MRILWFANAEPDIIHIHGTENPFGCIIGKTDDVLLLLQVVQDLWLKMERKVS
jgi:hypothetical protein